MPNLRSSFPPPPRRVTIPADILYQNVEGEAVLLDLRGEQYYSLDEVGTRVWALLAEHGDLDIVCSQLLVRYDVDEATLRRDLRLFVLELVEKGLVDIVKEPAANATELVEVLRKCAD